jgi:hypothetical protein
MPDEKPSLDELLRHYLSSDPGGAMSRLQVTLERLHNRLTEELASVRKVLEAHDDRIRRLEHPSQRPPTMGDLGKLVTSTGSWDTTAIDKVIAQREAAAALSRQKAILNAGGKVAIALVIAILLFAGGSFWRDLWGPRPTSTTSITTIAPGAGGK